MKRLLVIFICFILVFTLFSCKKDKNQTDSNQNTQSDSNNTDSMMDSSSVDLICQHSFYAWKPLTEADCSSEGVKIRICLKCNEPDYGVIEKNGVHKYGSTIFEPTCGEQGYTLHNCTLCEYSFKDAYTEPTELHNWEQDGEISNCQEKKVLYLCTVCNQEKEVEEEPTENHIFSNKVCTVCGLKEASEGLYFILSTDATYYKLNRIGTCKDADVIIPAMHEGLPVTEISKSAFYNCPNLKSVVIPSTVTTIEKPVFSYCTSLINITVDKNNPVFESIDGNLYTKGGKELVQYAVGKKDTSFKIPNGVTSIWPYAFYACENITEVTIPKGVTSFGDNAFNYCYYLTAVTIPGSVVSMGNSVFASCENLLSVTIEDGVKTLGKNTFGLCHSLDNVVIPSSITSLDYSVFSSCSGLTRITIPNSVVTIGDSAFHSCSGLASVDIGNGVTAIGKSAFYGCDNLTVLTIGSGLKTIGDNAFGSCNIKLVKNNSSLKLQLGSSSYGYVTLYATALMQKGVTMFAQTDYEYILTDDGFLYKLANDEYSLIAYCGTKDTITLPKSINGNSYTLSYVKGIINAIFPSGVTAINDRAFYGSSSLKSVIIPENVTSIGSYAFYECDNLDGVIIPKNVTSIGNNAFYRCDNLKSITIPKAVTSIGTYAFFSCQKLESVMFENTSGWYITGNSDSTTGTDISVTDTKTNAENLADEYYDMYWKRSL